MTDSVSQTPDGPPAAPPKPSAARRLVTWAVALACFGYLYYRISNATPAGETPLSYLASVFAKVGWGKWLLLMVPYSCFYFLIDSAVTWRVINWFNTKVGYTDILPIRASAYILSILNEQVGKGAMALYLYRRDRVPAWEVVSSMLFIMFCEFFYLLGWATLGYGLAGDQLPPQFKLIPNIAIGAVIFLVLWIAYFRGGFLPGLRLRERPLFHAFRQAEWWQYLVLVAIRSPALLAAVFVYRAALGLFGVEETLPNMLGILPVVFFGAAVPTPMRAAAITLWVVLYPQQEAQLAAFGLVMHNFFIFFNAAIGLLFLRRANRDLLE